MRRVLLTVFAIFLAVLLGTAWYVYNRGFTKKWRTTVMEEFRKRGVELYLRKLYLDPMRGLVAQGVRVLDTKNRKRALAEIDEMILQVNYANLLRGEPFLDALDLREATLSLPLDPENPQSPKVEISKLNARLFLPPQQIYLAHAEAEIYGIQVSASGRLINPQALRQPASPEKGQPNELVARVIEELKALKYEAAPPIVSLTFTGDLADPEKLFIELAVWGERIRRGNYLVKSLYLAACYRNGVIDLKKLTAADAAGSLNVDGTYQPSTREATLRLQSGLDVQGLTRAFRLAPQLDEFVFYTPPALELSVKATLAGKPEFQLLAHAALQKFAFRSVVFESLNADVSWDGRRWSARDVRLVHRSGEATGDAMQVPGDFRARLHSTINPKPLQPLLSGQVARVFSLFEFPDSPRLDVEVRGRELSVDALTATGDLTLGAASYRGVGCVSVTTKLRYASRTLGIGPFHLRRTEGESTGGLLFDFKRDEARLDNIKATVNPPEVALWIHPNFVKDIAPYRFKRAPNLVLDGVVHMKGGKTTKLSVDVDAPGGMDYTFMRRNLSAPQVAGKLLFNSDRMTIDGLSASLFGGRIKGDADISLARARPGHAVSLRLENVDFASLTRLYFGYEDSQGRLTARYDFTGRGDDARTMKGRGDLTVTDGNVFAIPFLGPFSGILNSIVPGMGYNAARKGSARFSVDDGVIETRDLVIEGKGFSMIGHGKLFFVDDRMDFDMRINAQGLPGVLLFPVSKLLEYTSDEKLSKPTWRPKVVPRL